MKNRSIKMFKKHMAYFTVFNSTIARNQKELIFLRIGEMCLYMKPLLSAVSQRGNDIILFPHAYSLHILHATCI